MVSEHGDFSILSSKADGKLGIFLGDSGVSLYISTISRAFSIDHCNLKFVKRKKYGNLNSFYSSERKRAFS